MGRLGKLDDRGKENVYVGYERGTKVYRWLDPTTHKLHLSQDEKFEEERKWNFEQVKV